MSTTANDAEPQLIRGVGLWGATMLNMIDMIGVGPFITIPLIIAAMAGRRRCSAGSLAPC